MPRCGLRCLAVAFVAAALVVNAHAYSCPDPLAIQDPKVRESFDLERFAGTYYELAFHDTQPGYPYCGCQRSVKTVAHTANGTYINDDFTLQCPQAGGKNYPSALSFNLTNQTGVFEGHWPLFKSLRIPDVLVDFKSDAETGQYAWVLELQCTGGDNAFFVGINFYSRDKTTEAFQEILASAKAHGIDRYWNSTKAGLTMVNHTGCVYPPPPAARA